VAMSIGRTFDLTATLNAAWRGGFSVKSNFAREHAEAIAAAACLGLITTQSIPRGAAFGRTWLITAKGLSHLSKLA
jgi:hypothetical protein